MKKKYLSVVLASCILSGIISGCSRFSDSFSEKRISEDPAETTAMESTTAKPESTEPDSDEEETTKEETTEAEDGQEQLSSTETPEFILPESNTRYMTYYDLHSLDSATLRIARNEIFARHGRMFQSEDLSQYFNSKSWYNGTIAPDAFNDNVFNDYERGNVSLMAAFQDGIPSGEYYGWDFMFTCFELSDGILTVIANPTSWGGGNEGFALSVPVSDSCRWWHTSANQNISGRDAEVKRMIEGSRATYLRSPSTYEDPIGVTIVVQNGMITEVRVYVS